jgi:dihydroorotate dehydrogenase
VGLRALQERAPLEALIDALMNERAQLRRRTGKSVAMLVKIAPDLTDQDKEDIADIALSRALDGLIVSNTTIDRPDTLQSPHKHEAGGLSGAPLFAPSTAMLADIYKLTQGKIPLIGVGGVASAEDAYAKIRAGASLVQLYSALVYQGFGLVPRINRGLAALLARDGFATVKDAVGK